jgi:PST family polysaccharide transporter
MTKSFTRRTLEGGAWIGAGSIARLGLRFVAVAVLARLLTPHQYGVVAGALLASEFLTMIYEIGLAPTLIQRTELLRIHIATALFSSLMLAVLVGVGMWISAPLVADVMDIPQLTSVFRVLSILAPIGAFNTICEALLARYMKTKGLALRTFVSYCVATFFVAIPMAWYGYGYWSLVAMQVAATLMDAIMLGLAARHLLVWPRFSRRAFSDLLPISLRFAVTEPLVYAAQNIEKVLISRFLGANALGLYTRASFLTTTAANVFTEITRLSVFPAMSRVKDDHERLQNGLLKFLCLTAFITLPISAFCIIFARPLIAILLGPQWEAAVGPFAVLSVGFYLRLSYRGIGAVFQAIGRPTWVSGVLIFRAVALFVGIWQVQQYGLTAISAVVVVVMALGYAIMLALAKRAIGLSLQRLFSTHLHPLAISLAIIGIGLALEQLLPYLPGLLAPSLTLLMIGVTALVIVRFDKKWLIGPSNMALFLGPDRGP